MIGTKYLIIGNGIAGLSAAREIRKLDNSGSLTMVTSEPYLTYYRMRLTEGLNKNFTENDLLVNPQSWYDENNISIMLRKIAETIDVDNNTVTLDDGQRVKYEKLLLATGGKSFIPPINGKFKDGVFALRTFGDLNHIKDYFKDKDRLAIIGGGLLGLEAAWALKSSGKNVSVVEFAPYLLPRQLDKELGDKLVERFRKEGINIYLPHSAEEIIGVEKATGIRVNGGDVIKADGILISSGTRPNLDLVYDSPVETNNGILVDEYLRTNIENIYAAGDAVEVDGKLIGLWTSSNEQGKIAGENMVGGNAKYVLPKLFSTLNLGDIKVFSAGDILDYTDVYEYKDDAKDIHHKLYVKNGEITGVILYGDLGQISRLRKDVFANTKIEEYLKTGLPFKIL